MPQSIAQSRYNKRVLLNSAGYAIALFGATAYFRNHPGAHGPAAYLAAVVPGLLIVGILVAIGRYLVEETDEYLRVLTVRQTLVASALALSIATIWGFLESADLAPHFDAYWVAVVWFGGLGVGALVNRLTIGRGA